MKNMEVNTMKYQNFRDDLLAIRFLLHTGQIDAYEAHEMREYVETLAV